MFLLHVTFLLFGLAPFAVSPESTGYIDYHRGTLNVILSAPHGGNENPVDIPNRDYGCYINGACVWSHNCGTKDRRRCKATTVTDGMTLELTMALHEELCQRFGRCPHTIINKLKRIKLDANHERDLASFNVNVTARAWDEYHGYIKQARTTIQSRGPGILFDIHGHGKRQQWAMLGYLVWSSRLRNGNFRFEETSIRALVNRTGINQFDDILRGHDSFGAYLQEEGFNAVPSPTYPHPNGYSYFSGGYITKMYGSRNGGTVDAIQIESPSSYRYTRADQYVKGLACAIERFLVRNYLKFDK